MEIPDIKLGSSAFVSCMAFSHTLALLYILSIPTLAQGQTVGTITDLGTLGGSFSTANAINGKGQVVGTSSSSLSTTTNSQHAFLYSGGNMIDLTEALAPLGATYSVAYGINDAGSVVGEFGVSDGLTGDTRAFLYTPATESQAEAAFNLCPNISQYSVATAINNTGQIVGHTTLCSPVVGNFVSGNEEGFLYAGGTVTDIGNLGYDGYGVYGINAQGQVVGSSETSNVFRDGFLALHSFLFSDGKIVDLLNPFLGEAYSEAHAINDNGRIVGWYSYNPSILTRQSFLYTLPASGSVGAFQNLNFALGASASEALSINNSGQIVGWFITPATSGSSHAFLYSGGKAADLNSLLPPGSGWELLQANAINDAGQIVGEGLINGQVHAFLFSIGVGTPISYYVKTTNSNTLASMGKALADSQLAATAPGGFANNIVTLVFGQPTFNTASQQCTGSNPVADCYGATGFMLGQKIPLSQIASLVEDFVDGYYNETGANSAVHMRIVIATSNHGHYVTMAHGQAWAELVNAVASWVKNQGYWGQVDIAGGSDMEPNWNTPGVTRSWVNGYALAYPQPLLYDIGDAAGCPQDGTSAAAGSCNNSWTQNDLWYVSWGAKPSLPLPEIYRTDGAQASQWAELSLYGYLRYGTSMLIAATLTESARCQQLAGTSSPCSAVLLNTPTEALQQLDEALGGDMHTKQTIGWSTDIKASSH